MAKLTKQQKLELQQITEERDIARALSWPNFPKPIPISKPTEWGKEIQGWTINVHFLMVNEEIQDMTSSYAFYEGKRSKNGRRNRGDLYATRREAYLALYHELCVIYGIELAKVLKKAQEE